VTSVEILIEIVIKRGLSPDIAGTLVILKVPLLMQIACRRKGKVITRKLLKL
jgi:hypothetical protein